MFKGSGGPVPGRTGGVGFNVLRNDTSTSMVNNPITGGNKGTMSSNSRVDSVLDEYNNEYDRNTVGTTRQFNNNHDMLSIVKLPQVPDKMRTNSAPSDRER